MTFDEAMEKVVLGYYARHDNFAPNGYVRYDFDGFRIEFNHNGRVGSSSGWWGEQADFEADWYITNAIVPPAWGDFQQVNWDIGAAVDIADEPAIMIEKPIEGWPIFARG